MRTLVRTSTSTTRAPGELLTLLQFLTFTSHTHIFVTPIQVLRHVSGPTAVEPSLCPGVGQNPRRDPEPFEAEATPVSTLHTRAAKALKFSPQQRTKTQHEPKNVEIDLIVIYEVTQAHWKILHTLGERSAKKTQDM